MQTGTIRLRGSLIGWQSLQSLSGETANAYALCARCRSISMLLLPLCLCQERKFAPSAVLLATLSADSSSYFHLPPASQELIKSHSLKAFAVRQFLISAPHRLEQRVKELDHLTPCALFLPSPRTHVSTAKIITPHS